MVGEFHEVVQKHSKLFKLPRKHTCYTGQYNYMFIWLQHYYIAFEERIHANIFSFAWKDQKIYLTHLLMVLSSLQVFEVLKYL